MVIRVDVIGIDRARSRIAELIDKVQAGPVMVTRNGEPAAVILAPEDYESLTATVELLSHPDYQRQKAALGESPDEYSLHADVLRDLETRGGDG
jgi:prevent-host-death family protein